MSWLFASGGPKYGSFSFSISSSNEYSGLISFRIDWFDLLAGLLGKRGEHAQLKGLQIPVLTTHSPSCTIPSKSLVDYSQWGSIGSSHQEAKVLELQLQQHQKPIENQEHRRVEVHKVSRPENEQLRNDSKRQIVPGAPSAPRRGRGGHRGGRGRFGIRRAGPMKFEKDFDFESANAQFNKEEIDREFHSKLKLKEDKLEKQEKPVNGEDKGDSGVDTQNSEGNADEEDPLGPNCYYDKTKSFFDNISCDDNRERRPTWAEERRLNAETFGIPLRPNRGRGGYRGRGGLGFRGGRGRGSGRGGTFTTPRGFCGGFRGGRGGREFADFEYRKDNKVAA
ncbi:hypothetical protein FD754_010177 [Muntiacus muntjak]|uniref:DFDF domain-containing protein n=1 Tax=Muntiacus muntjak TaxID=9888 RepID=A0A5N3WWK6_MUNMU|nr:hypothetical protein FD754_010177 [Muntiacus muntjak]